jgi:hypothetical protein
MSIYDFSPFKNSSFAETISYTPSGGTAVSIKAVVFRHGSQKLAIQGGISPEYFPVIIEVDSADVPLVTTKEDVVLCKDARGETKSLRVSKILYADAGCFKLGLGA